MKPSSHRTMRPTAGRYAPVGGPQSRADEDHALQLSELGSESGSVLAASTRHIAHVRSSRAQARLAISGQSRPKDASMARACAACASIASSSASMATRCVSTWPAGRQAGRQAGKP